MNKEASPFQKTDSWLLVSVIWASKEQPATLPQIDAAGDYINHTPFTETEMNGGLLRLLAGDWIAGQDNAWTATPKALQEYKKIEKENSSVFVQMERLSQLL